MPHDIARPIAPLVISESIAPMHLRPKDAARRVGISMTTLWSWIAAGKLPKPKKLCANISVFPIAEFDAAFAALLDADRAA